MKGFWVKTNRWLWMLPLLTGCAVGPDFVVPEEPKLSAYTPGGNPAATTAVDTESRGQQHFKTAQEVDAHWWERFGSASLNQLVEAGLKNSPTVLSAQATLENAQFSALAQKDSLFVPSVSASVADTREQFSSASIGQPGHQYLFNLANAQVGVTYNLDLFGGNRRQLEAFMAQAEASGYLWQAARMTLASNIVTTALRESGVQAQIDEVKKQILLEEELLSIARAREAAGAISAMDVKNQEISLANLAANLPPLEKQQALLHHQLSVYLGQSPAEGLMKSVSFQELKLPTDLPLLVPSTLVHRRPDILVAEAALHQATAELGVATAAVYPNLSLSANYGVTGPRSATLFSSQGPVWSLGGTLLQPLFNGGALENSKNAAQARVRQSAFQYQSAVLAAFQNVADSLRSLESDAALLKTQSETTRALMAQYGAAQAQYQAGGIAYVTLLQTRERLSQAKAAAIQTETNRLCDTAALYLAMGGGWWNREPLSTGVDQP